MSQSIIEPLEETFGKLDLKGKVNSCPPGFEEFKPKPFKLNTEFKMPIEVDGDNDDVFEPESSGNENGNQASNSHELQNSTPRFNSKLDQNSKPYHPNHPVNIPRQTQSISEQSIYQNYHQSYMSHHPPQNYQMQPYMQSPPQEYQHLHYHQTYTTTSPPQLITPQMISPTYQSVYLPVQMPIYLPVRDPNFNDQRFSNNYIEELGIRKNNNFAERYSPENQENRFLDQRRYEQVQNRHSERHFTENRNFSETRQNTPSKLQFNNQVQRPISQGSQRSGQSQASNSPRYSNNSPRYSNGQYSDQNLYIAGFDTKFDLDTLKTHIIRVVKSFGGLEIAEDEFSVQVKESNKALLEAGEQLSDKSCVSKFDQLKMTENSSFEQSSQKPSQNYAFLDFEDKKLAQKVLDLLVSREKTPLRDELLSTFGENFNCKRAKKQNQDMTNVFFKGQPEIFRNIEEYNSSDSKDKNNLHSPKNHSYNEQEIVLTAIHIYLLNAGVEKGTGSEDFHGNNFENLGESGLKKVVSLRIQSDQKTKGNDPNPGLICLIRYKQEDDARKIIKTFGGTEDRSDTLNRPTRFLDAGPIIKKKIDLAKIESSEDENRDTEVKVASNLVESTKPLPKLADLSPDFLITIIRKLQAIDWPKFGDNTDSPNGKKVSKVGEGAWEKAIKFCQEECYKFESKQDLIEVKYANTQQEKNRKTPEKYGEAFNNGHMMSPEMRYYRGLSPVGAGGAYRTPMSSMTPMGGNRFVYSSCEGNRRYSTPEFRDANKGRPASVVKTNTFSGKKYDPSLKYASRSAHTESWRRPTVRPSTSQTIKSENVSPPSMSCRGYAVSDKMMKTPSVRSGKTYVNMKAWREQSEQKMKQKRSSTE